MSMPGPPAAGPALMVTDGRYVGSVGARLDAWHGVADVGYWVDADHEGRGLVTRAVGAVITHLVRDRGMARVELRIHVDNTRSLAVADRLGFVREGVLRSAHRTATGRADLALLAVLAEDWIG